MSDSNFIFELKKSSNEDSRKVVPFAIFSPSQFIVHVVKEKSKVISHELGLMAEQTLIQKRKGTKSPRTRWS